LVFSSIPGVHCLNISLFAQLELVLSIK